LGYIGILQHKEHPPKVWHIPPETPCITDLKPSVISLFKILGGIPYDNRVMTATWGRWQIKTRENIFEVHNSRFSLHCQITEQGKPLIILRRFHKYNH
jgi:hypothetical protein